MGCLQGSVSRCAPQPPQKGCHSVPGIEIMAGCADCQTNGNRLEWIHACMMVSSSLIAPHTVTVLWIGHNTGIRFDFVVLWERSSLVCVPLTPGVQLACKVLRASKMEECYFGKVA